MPARLDTFSKFLAPGLRLGWACAAPAVVAKLAQAMAAQCLGASGVCQVGSLRAIGIAAPACKRPLPCPAAASRVVVLPTQVIARRARDARVPALPPCPPVPPACPPSPSPAAPRPRQALTAQLLESWGPAGLETHLQAIQANYAAQCAALAAAAERELGGLAEWWVPRAGMFLVSCQSLVAAG